MMTRIKMKNLKSLSLVVLVLVGCVCKVDVVYADRVDELIKQLRHRHPDNREAAAEALGEIGDKRAVEPLIAALRDENWDVQKAAAEALGKIGDARAVEPLIDVLTLRDPDWMVYKAAIEALGNTGDARRVELFIGIWRASEAIVREAAVKALGKIGEPAIEPLKEVVKKDSNEVRKAAKEALKNIQKK